MDGGQHSSRSSVYLIIISFSLTAVLIIIYHWMTKFYRRQQERGQVPQFFGPARGTELMLSTDASTVQMLAPALTYKKTEEDGGEDGYGGGFGEEKTCPVCLSDFEDGDAVRVMPECGHCFHVDCIDRWLQSHSTCPVCRSQNFSV